MFNEVSYLVVGVAISILLAFILTSGTTWKAKAYDAFLSGLLGALAVLLLQVLLATRDVTAYLQRLDQPTSSGEFDRAIRAETMPPFRLALEDLKSRNSELLQNAAHGDIALSDAAQVIIEWNRMFSSTRTSVIATNYISERFWKDDPDFSRLQDGAHRRAITAGVTVARIFIFDAADAKQLTLLRNVSEQQKRLGVQVRYLNRTLLERSEPYLDSKSRLGGTIDFVVFDRQAALLTIHRPETREIWRGTLTKSRNRVDAATRLFGAAWNLSSATIEEAVSGRR